MHPTIHPIQLPNPHALLIREATRLGLQDALGSKRSIEFDLSMTASQRLAYSTGYRAGRMLLADGQAEVAL